jgi:excisionase family DNA binding protein
MPGIDPDDLITISAAAEEKGCSRTTLYRAISDDRLNAVEVGNRRMLVRDETFEAFEPEWKGERVRKYGDEDTDSSE